MLHVSPEEGNALNQLSRNDYTFSEPHASMKADPTIHTPVHERGGVIAESSNSNYLYRSYLRTKESIQEKGGLINPNFVGEMLAEVWCKSFISSS